MSLFLSRFRELLAESGKMQKDICAELGISRPTLSNWKTGYSEPNFDDIIMLAKYFDVSSDYLLGLSDDLDAPLYSPLTVLYHSQKSLSTKKALPERSAFFAALVAHFFGCAFS